MINVGANIVFCGLLTLTQVYCNMRIILNYSKFFVF